jgi:hypothetical protein
MKTLSIMCAAIGLAVVTSVSEGRTLRATEISPSAWAQLSMQDKENLTIEFRQGDRIPINITAQGDLVETVSTGTQYLSVKRNFWLRFQSNEILVSLDGQHFSHLKDILSGSLEAGVGTDDNTGIANAIQIAFKAYLK